MPSDGDFAALVDMRFNIVLIEDFVGGFSFEAFERDWKTLYAVTRALEIISEASRRLSEDLRNRHPAIPWREMRDAGNKYRHEYDGISASRLWRTANESLAPLLAVVEAELAAADRDISPSGSNDL